MAILSDINSVFNILEKIKQNSLFKTILILLFSASIILVKPVIYYSTLYSYFCDITCALLILMALFCFFYVKYNKKHENYYDKETTNVLFYFSVLLFILILSGRIKCNGVFEELLAKDGFTKESFGNLIHYTKYDDDFYGLVFNKFGFILLYCFQFVQAASTIYLLGYVLITLLSNKESIKIGFYQEDYKIILLNTLIIFLTSPSFYQYYIEFGNKIF